MRVKDFVRMYKGFACIRVEIYASVSVFNEEYYVLVASFDMVCAKIYPVKRENYLSEEATGFEIVNGSLRIFIRGCE
jgi:hypothetical protein